MTTLVLTVVGNDRPGLVAAVAEVVEEHDGNWENSQLAELAGAFAGVIEVSVPAARVPDLQAALGKIAGLHTLAVQAEGGDTPAQEQRELVLEILGNDHPGIVREVSRVLSGHQLSIESMTTETRDAAMSGGRLFHARVAASVPTDLDLEVVRGDLERLATEIQVDLSLAD